MKKNKFLTTGLAIAIFSLSFFVVNLVSARIYNPSNTAPNFIADSTTAISYFLGKVGIGTTAPAYELDVDGFTNTKSNYEVSDEGLVLGMNFNTETITGTAGSETVLDSSTYNNHGTNDGATHDPDGGFNGGGAFSFDGTDDYIETGYANNFSAITLSLWVKTNEISYSDNKSWFINDADDNDIFRFRFYGNKIRINISGLSDIDMYSDVFPMQEWVHFLFSYDGVTKKIYVNGELTNSENATGNINIGSLMIGHSSSSFDGSIDNVKIYNRVLSADEIKAQYLQRAEVGDSYVSQSDVFVDSSGNVGIGTVSPTATLHTIQTATTGNTLSVSRDLASASTDSPVVNIVQDNVGDDQDALTIQNDGTGKGLHISQVGILAANKYALDVYSNTNIINTNGALVRFFIDNSNSNKPVIILQNDGTGSNIFIDKNNSGYGIDIDGNADSASDLTGLRVNATNAGAGEAYSAIFETGNVGIGVTDPATKLEVAGAITQSELSADPSDPAEGKSVTWQSDGTGSGDDGDIMMKITAGGVTKTATLVDFSAI